MVIVFFKQNSKVNIYQTCFLFFVFVCIIYNAPLCRRLTHVVVLGSR